MVLEVRNVTKSFGKKTVLKDVSVQIAENEIVAFVGANGSGKTTLMKCILGFLPFEGDIRVMGEPVSFGETKSNEHIGYLPDVPQFYNFYNAKQYLKLCQKVSGNVSNERIDEMLTLVGLAGRKEKIHQYSRGMKQRLGIAQALLHKPKLLICDEPTSALDPEGRAQILSILQAAKEETAILFSTHILSEAEHISDRMMILHDQKIRFDGPITRQAFTGHYYVEVNRPLDVQLLQAFQLEKSKQGYILQVVDEAEKDLFLKQLMASDYSLQKFTLESQSLEQFVQEVMTK